MSAIYASGSSDSTAATGSTEFSVSEGSTASSANTCSLEIIATLENGTNIEQTMAYETIEEAVEKRDEFLTRFDEGKPFKFDNTSHSYRRSSKKVEELTVLVHRW